MFLTTFLFEEAKHTDFFTRFLEEIAEHQADLSHFHSPSYQLLFYDALPKALQALQTDSSPAAQVRASVTYNMIVEGVLAETGYYAYYKILEAHDLMPGVRQGIHLLKQDESRHIAYGVYLLSRLIAEDEQLFTIVQETMNALLPIGLGIINDIFSSYEIMPFGLQQNDFTDFALAQFQKRLARIEKAKAADLAEVQQITQQIIDANDG
jgi:ribonucleoside-diphosphate reductase beta chain